MRRMPPGRISCLQQKNKGRRRLHPADGEGREVVGSSTSSFSPLQIRSEAVMQELCWLLASMGLDTFVLFFKGILFHPTFQTRIVS